MRRISGVPTGGAKERYKFDNYNAMSSLDIYKHKMNIIFLKIF